VLIGPIVNGNFGLSKAYKIAMMAVKKKKKSKPPDPGCLRIGDGFRKLMKHS